MKLPKGWSEIHRGHEWSNGTARVFFISSINMMYEEGWWVRPIWNDETNEAGPFKTAREAFAALGVKVEEGK